MNAHIDAPQDRDREVSGFIILVSLLQGLALYLVVTGKDAGWGFFSQLSGQIYWYSLILSVPTLMTLSVASLRDPRFWQHVALALVIWLALASWAAWSATNLHGVQADDVLAPFGSMCLLGEFIALPYLQCRLASGRWRPDYAQLVDHAWQNGLTLLLVLPFVGLCWAVLELWGSLFKLIGIDFFASLFRETAFIYLASGTMVGLGIWIARSQHRPLRLLREVLFAVCRGLLPVLALLAVMFVLALPFKGLVPLWNTGHATVLLLTLIALIVLFTNAVFQDGKTTTAYPRPVQLLINAGLASLPLYAGISLYAMWLRLADYGWTGPRVLLFAAVLLMGGHALSYAWAALSRRGGWMHHLPAINISLSLCTLAAIAALNSPLIDPWRISVSSQVARLSTTTETLTSRELDYLRFHAGRRGYEALLALRESPAFAGSPERLATIDHEIEKPFPWGRDITPKVATIEELRQSLTLAPGASADADWLQWLLNRKDSSSICLTPHSQCVVLTMDLDHDGQSEQLLCGQTSYQMNICEVSTRDATGWTEVGQYGFGLDFESWRKMLQQGQIHIIPRRWPDLAIDGQKSSLK